MGLWIYGSTRRAQPAAGLAHKLDGGGSAARVTVVNEPLPDRAVQPTRKMSIYGDGGGESVESMTAVRGSARSRPPALLTVTRPPHISQSSPARATSLAVIALTRIVLVNRIMHSSCWSDASHNLNTAAHSMTISTHLTAWGSNSRPPTSIASPPPTALSPPIRPASQPGLTHCLTSRRSHRRHRRPAPPPPPAPPRALHGSQYSQPQASQRCPSPVL